MLKRPAILCACLLFAAVLVFGLARLFELRFDQGDLYPPYSTLRADPLGASIIYESLERVPDVTVHRYFEDTFKNDDGHARTLFVLGAQPYSVRWLSRSEFDVLQRFVFNGGRVVIAYFPEVNETWSSRMARTNETDWPSPTEEKRKRHSRRTNSQPDGVTDEASGETNRVTGTNNMIGTNTVTSTNAVASTNDAGVITLKGLDEIFPSHRTRDPRRREEQEQKEEMKQEMRRYADLSEEWGFHFNYKNLGTNDAGGTEFPDAKIVAANRDLPALLPIHTALCFTNLTNGWTVVYQRDKKTPVVVERKFGAGAVVLVADSYPLSNEAMFKNRSAPLLAWLLGGGRDAIFDEAHLGVVEQPGMATLMRRYRLHGLMFALVVAAGLFVWKNSQSLVPPQADVKSDAGPVVTGRDSAAGFVNLLRRGITPAEIINVCFAEWKKSSARLAAISPAQRRDVEQLVQQQAALEPRLRKPVENYRVLSQILKRRK